MHHFTADEPCLRDEPSPAQSGRARRVLLIVALVTTSAWLAVTLAS